MKKQYKIVRLTAANVKRLQAVEINPEGNLVVVGGKNGAGKSSVLDSIMMALGGGWTHCSKPIRDGEDRGTVDLDLGDLIVHRVFNPGGTTLTVTNADGAKYTSPQKMLDGLVGQLSFDPLAFSDMKAPEQADTLQGLMGPDFVAKMRRIESDIKVAYEDRALINRQVKDFGTLEPVEPCDPPRSLAEVLAERAEVEAFNSQQYERAQVRDDANRKAQDAAREVERLQRELDQAEEAHKAAYAAMRDLPKPDPPKPLAEIDRKLGTIEEHNAKARRFRDYQTKLDDLKELQDKAAGYEKSLASMRQDRQDLFAGAEFPIEGLAFGDGQVLFNGLPFDQASRAEQLRVSVAMGLAMNPALKVLLIRDGSLLDADNLRMVAEMAAEAGAQVWIERVGEGKECQVIIEDGRVRALPYDESKVA